jgi:general secretion pathway protein A
MEVLPAGFDDQRQSRPDAELSASDFYQFSEKPFEDNPDPKFLYVTASYQGILDHILTWIKDGNGCAVITGDAGTGKTFFIHALVNHLDEKVIPILVQNPVTTLEDLLKAILFVPGQPTHEKSKTGLFRRFRGFLNQMMAQDKTLLIILDEAQGLNDQILDHIERFFDMRSKRIRIIFVGQPRLNGRLNSLGLRRLGQKIETKQKLKPFTEEESCGYIDHRLRLVGSGSEIMTPKAISMICSYTQGVSSLINHVCDNALRVGCTMNRKRINVDIVEKVIQNLEGPRNLPKPLPSIQPIKRIWKYPFQFSISFKKFSMAVFLLACLGGLIFLFHESMGRRTGKIQVITSPIGGNLAKPGPSTHKPSAQGTTERILKKERISTSVKPKLTQPESSSFQRNKVLLTSGRQQPAEATRDESLSMVHSAKKEESLPSLEIETGLKADYPEETPKLPHDASKTLKTQGLTLTHFFAADKGPYGVTWQIYIEAEDPQGDMDKISVDVDQVNYSHYPTEWIKIRPQYRKHLMGFLQWNTYSSKASSLPDGTQISVKISIFDLAGNKSNEVIIPFTFGSGVINRYHPPAPFDKENIPRIGHVMVDLCSSASY